MLLNKQNEIFSRYSFELYEYQKKSIIAIEEGKNVLATAPTGSGKTLLAKYAIEKFCTQEENIKKRRVIYTAPVKALVNEKFGKLRKDFPNISFGILSGDIQENPLADCLIMTTEILWKTIFQQRMIKENNVEKDKLQLHFEFDIETELAAVIWDEGHMINDKQRGTVYEEAMSQLPKDVVQIILSATIGNPEIITDWLPNIIWAKETHRKVPLYHNIFFGAPDSFYKKVYDKKIKNLLLEIQNKSFLMKSKDQIFDDDLYYKIGRITSYMKKNKMYINRTFALNRIIKYLFDNESLPAICFVFSIKWLNKYAESISINLHGENSPMTHNVEKECRKILSSKFSNFKEYTQLPEYKWLIKLLEKGIGVHNSGMLPVFRELVEKLFEIGYVKLLFATETFAIGINMPTKSVIYTGLTKYENGHFRNLHSHEYIQGGGRAGRPGDKEGNVYHLINFLPDLFESSQIVNYKKILSNKSQNIESHLRIDFNLVLRLLSTNVDYTKFMENTLFQHTLDKELVFLKKDLEQLQEKYNRKKESLQYTNIPFDIIEKYMELKEKISICSRKQQKKFSRELTNLEGEYKKIHVEYHRRLEVQNIYSEIKKIKKHIEYNENFLSDTFTNMISTLKKYEFVTDDNKLTSKGLISANVNEIHCLTIGDVIGSELFKECSVIDIICILSIFTNVSVPRQERINNTDELDIPLHVKKIIKNIENIFEQFTDIENQYYINSTDQYNIHYELCEMMYNWVSVKDEKDSLYVYDICKKKGITVGNFTKCILKINNISNELQKACLMINNIELMNKLSQIGDHILKSVTSNQSLYV